MVSDAAVLGRRARAVDRVDDLISVTWRRQIANVTTSDRNFTRCWSMRDIRGVCALSRRVRCAQEGLVAWRELGYEMGFAVVALHQADGPFF